MFAIAKRHHSNDTTPPAQPPSSSILNRSEYQLLLMFHHQLGSIWPSDSCELKFRALLHHSDPLAELAVVIYNGREQKESRTLCVCLFECEFARHIIRNVAQLSSVTVTVSATSLPASTAISPPKCFGLRVQSKRVPVNCNTGTPGRPRSHVSPPPPASVRRRRSAIPPYQRRPPQAIMSHDQVKATNITAVKSNVSRSKRAEMLGVDSSFRGCTVWFTGQHRTETARLRQQHSSPSAPIINCLLRAPPPNPLLPSSLVSNMSTSLSPQPIAGFQYVCKPLQRPPNPVSRPDRPCSAHRPYPRVQVCPAPARRLSALPQRRSCAAAASRATASTVTTCAPG